MTTLGLVRKRVLVPNPAPRAGRDPALERILSGECSIDEKASMLSRDMTRVWASLRGMNDKLKRLDGNLEDLGLELSRISRSLRERGLL